MVVDMKGDTSDSMILERLFLATKKALIDVETGELCLKFNKEKMVFNVYEWTPYIYDMEACYQMEEKSSKVDKGRKKGKLSGVWVTLALDVCLRHGLSN